MKARHYLRYPVDIIRAKRRLGRRYDESFSRSGRTIVLDLYTTDLLLDCGRHFAAIAHFALRNDAVVVIRCRSIVLAAITHKPFGSKMLEMENVSWVDESSSIPADAVVLTDIPACAVSRPCDHSQIVEMLIGKDHLQQVPVMPYPMHPSQLQYADRMTLQGARETNNRRGIFFAGSQRAKYGRDVLMNGFGVLNRLEILALVRESFAERVVQSLAESDHQMPIILPPTQPNDASVPISADQWLATLARHQFFLCCPGIAQPMCHNIVEAMSVGVIPIIEYPDRFSPALMDNVNAIVFHGREGLHQAIERIDRLSDRAIQQMSANAASFYDRHLDGKAFFEALLTTPMEERCRKIVLPFHDENLTAMKAHLSQGQSAAA